MNLLTIENLSKVFTERQVFGQADFSVNEGEKIGVKLIRPNADGVREFAGILKGREGSTVTVETENGPVSFEVSAASSVHLCDDEHLFD